MTVAAIRPNGTVSEQWQDNQGGVANHTVVDNVQSYPTTTPGSDWIVADGWMIGNNLVDDFNYGDLSDVGVVTQIKIYTLGRIMKFGGAAYYPECRYSINGGSSWSGYHDCTSLNIVTSTTDTTCAWDVWTITGLSWTQAQINAIRVQYVSDCPNGDKYAQDWNWIHVAYIEVTYSPPGYAHKVIGVAPSNIDKIIGVSKTSINKVIGK